MIRKAVIVSCTFLAFGTAVLLLVSSIRPLAWTGPEKVGPTAYAVAAGGGNLVVDYWRCVEASSRGRTTYDLHPLFTYEHEVTGAPARLSGTYDDPAPFTLTVAGDGRGALVMTWTWVTLWVPLLVFSAYPTLAFILGPVRRWRRRRKGLFVKCGYNLTGNVSGVCPECGREVAPSDLRVFNEAGPSEVGGGMENTTPHIKRRSRSLLSGLLWPSWPQRKRMLYREAQIFVIASYAVVLFAFLWPADFRNQSPMYVWTAWVAFMIRTFVFPFGLVLCGVTVVAACARVWKLFAAALPLAVFTVGPTLWEFRPRSTPAVEGESVVIMSVNLLMVNRSTRPIIEEIRTVAPDVLLLQEYTSHWHEALQSTIARDYPHISFERRQDSFGAAVYSKIPFEESTEVHLPLGQAIVPQIRTVIRIGDEPVAVYNVHLLPPWGLEYTTEHRIQFADLVELLASEPYPVVLGGDFNFTERSPQAAVLGRHRLRDAHPVGGWGRGATWPANSFFRWIPGLRLDHLYISEGLTCIRCRTGAGIGSDHRPIVAEIGKARQAGLKRAREPASIGMRGHTCRLASVYLPCLSVGRIAPQ